KLQTASDQVDVIRKEIVATKEGGMITGEERLREHLCNLYNGVAFYDGAPTQTEIDRTDAINRELSDVGKKFDDWSAKELSQINSALAGKELPAVKLLTREEWEKQNEKK